MVRRHSRVIISPLLQFPLQFPVHFLLSSQRLLSPHGSSSPSGSLSLPHCFFLSFFLQNLPILIASTRIPSILTISSPPFFSVILPVVTKSFSFFFFFFFSFHLVLRFLFSSSLYHFFFFYVPHQPLSKLWNLFVYLLSRLSIYVLYIKANVSNLGGKS